MEKLQIQLFVLPVIVLGLLLIIFLSIGPVTPTNFFKFIGNEYDFTTGFITKGAKSEDVTIRNEVQDLEAEISSIKNNLPIYEIPNESFVQNMTGELKILTAAEKIAKISSEIKEDGYSDVIVTLAPNSTLFNSNGLDIEYSFISSNSYKVKLTKDGMHALSENPNVRTISPDMKIPLLLKESVPLMRANQVWNITVNGTNITGKDVAVCVTDTGVNYTNEFISHAYVGGYDFVNHDSDPMDDAGHGTAVSGIIVSNDTTYRGVAPDAKLIMVKVVDSSGSAYVTDMTAGIEWCVHNATNATGYTPSAISVSLGMMCLPVNCDGTEPVYVSAINDAVAHNISVFIGSGNGGNKDCIAWPACISNATSVGSVDDGSGYFYYDWRNVTMPIGNSQTFLIRNGTYGLTGQNFTVTLVSTNGTANSSTVQVTSTDPNFTAFNKTYLFGGGENVSWNRFDFNNDGEQDLLIWVYMKPSGWPASVIYILYAYYNFSLITDQVSSFTDRGPILDLLTPGNKICTTSISGGIPLTNCGGGTSYSAPHAAGAAALLVQYYNLTKGHMPTAYFVKNTFKDTGVPINDSPSNFVYPRVDLINAVTEANNKVRFVEPTDERGILLYKNNINFSIETDYSNTSKVTVRLYDEDGLINVIVLTNRPYNGSFTNLKSGNYYIDATAHNISGEESTTSKRMFRVVIGGCFNEDPYVTSHLVATCGNTIIQNCNLTEDIYASGNCFKVEHSVMVVPTSDGITIDCQGHKIIGSFNDDMGGIYTTNTTSIVIKNCTFENFNKGIFIDGSRNSYILNNTFTSNNYGVYYENYSSASIKNNKFIDNGEAVYINNGAGFSQSGNHFWYARETPDTITNLTRTIDLRSAANASFKFDVLYDIYPWYYDSYWGNVYFDWFAFKVNNTELDRLSGSSNDTWITHEYSLNNYTGSIVNVTFDAVFYPFVAHPGVYLDNFELIINNTTVWTDDVENGTNGWSSNVYIYTYWGCDLPSYCPPWVRHFTRLAWNITRYDISDNEFYNNNIGLHNYRLDNVNIINNSIHNNDYVAIKLDSSDSELININNISYNRVGISIDNSKLNSIANNIIKENSNYDVDIAASDVSACNNAIENNTGSGDRNIYYYNDSVSLNNVANISELIFCNADNSNLKNVTVKGSDSLKNNGIIVLFTDGINISNSRSLENYIGLHIINSSNNSIVSDTFTENIKGIYLENSNNNSINLNNVSNNVNGLEIDSGSIGNSILNNTIKENEEYDLLPYSCSNKITNNIGSGNKQILFYNSTVNLVGPAEMSELILCGVTNSIIENITIEGSETLHNNGLLLVYTNNTNISNINSSNNLIGINSLWSNSNRILDNILQENKNFDMFIFESVNNIILNNNGSGNRPIIYLENITQAINETLSELILQNINNAVIDNVTINGSDTLRNNGLILIRTNNTNISNSESTGNYYGIYEYISYNNRFFNTILSDNIVGLGSISSFSKLYNGKVIDNILAGINGSSSDVSWFINDFSMCTNNNVSIGGEFALSADGLYNWERRNCTIIVKGKEIDYAWIGYYSDHINIPANADVTIGGKDNIFELEIRNGPTEYNGTINISSFNKIPKNITGYRAFALGTWINITSKPDIDIDSATIKIYYNDNQLKFGRFIADSLYIKSFINRTWEEPSGGANITEGYVWADINRLSGFGIFSDTLNVSEIGGGGGGAGGGAPSGQSYAIDISQPQIKILVAKDKVSFTVLGESHSAKIISIGSDSVTIEISSTPFNVTVNVGETKLVDTNGNGYDDLSIFLEKIYIGKAYITFSAIAEPVVEKPVEKPPVQEKPAIPEIMEPPPLTPERKEDLFRSIIIIGAFLAMAVAGIWMYTKMVQEIRASRIPEQYS